MRSLPLEMVCLDMAGTTVTDQGAVEDAFVDALVASGVGQGTERFEGARAYMRATMGQSKIDVFTALFDGDWDMATAANRIFERSYGASVTQGRISAIPGAEETMDVLSARGIKVCLTTGFSPNTREAVITSLGWEDRIDLALSPSDCGRGRPYPDMILSAILLLRVDDVRSVVVVGDTTSDLWSGRRSGAGAVVGVLTGAHDKDQLLAVPDAQVLASVAELPAFLFE